MERFSVYDDGGFEKLLGDMVEVPDDKSVMLSELFFLYHFCKSYDIRRVVESGTYKGLTAKRLSLLFPDARVFSFEKRKPRWKAIPEKHRDPRISYILGTLDEKCLTKHTLLLIDGPKRNGAINLAVKMRSKVSVIAIHDMREYEHKLKKRFKNVLLCGDLAICT